MKLFYIALFFYCLSSSCSHTNKLNKLIWSDEFNYNGPLDSTKWNYEVGNGCPTLCGWGNNEAEIYTHLLDNVKVENGLLKINAIKINGQWTSGRVTTQKKVNFTYGWIEFRTKLPKGKGTWPALWMMGEKKNLQGWPDCGEIDIMEHVGRKPGIVQSALHTPASYGKTINIDSTVVKSFNTDFHVFQAHWTPEKIEFLVDDRVYYTYRPDHRNRETWPFDTPFFVLINLAMGGGLGGPIDPLLTSAEFQIDYVRIYQ